MLINSSMFYQLIFSSANQHIFSSANQHILFTSAHFPHLQIFKFPNLQINKSPRLCIFEKNYSLEKFRFHTMCIVLRANHTSTMAGFNTLQRRHQRYFFYRSTNRICLWTRCWNRKLFRHNFYSTDYQWRRNVDPNEHRFYFGFDTFAFC